KSVPEEAVAFAKVLCDQNFLIVCSEKYISPKAQKQLYDLIIAAGKDPEKCLIVLREKNNSMGLLQLGFGKKDLLSKLNEGSLRNIFVFGEDPVGCAFDKKKVKEWISTADFVVVQDHFMTETVKMADLALPASFPVISGGAYM